MTLTKEERTARKREQNLAYNSREFNAPIIFREYELRPSVIEALYATLTEDGPNSWDKRPEKLRSLYRRLTGKELT